MAKAKTSFRREHPTLIRALLLLLTFGIAVGAGLAYGAWALVCRGGQCPPVDALNDYTPRQTSKLYAADGRFIAELGLERRTLVKLDEIPETVQQAFVITEDKRFYRHAGIDWSRVFGALARDILARSWDEGFSTITMQLARNVFPERISREKTLVRKIKEGKVAREIERKFDKKKILELYLNQINLGNGAYGVETAAQRYFGKSVRDLNVAEAATLAALPKAPERYNPQAPSRARNSAPQHSDRADASQRRDHRCAGKRRRGHIPLQLASKTDAGDTAPYFVEWIRQQLDAQFGRQLYEQGLRVYTTLDLDMQLAAERRWSASCAHRRRQVRKVYRRELRAYIARSVAGQRARPEFPLSPGSIHRDRSAQRRGESNGRRA